MTKNVKKSLAIPCPKCHIMEGKRCLDMRTPQGKTRYLKNPHQERLDEAKKSTHL